MNEDKFATCLGLIVSIVLVIAITTFMSGWALSTIWNWYMPALFHLVSLTLWQAIGVSMVFSLFSGTSDVERAKTSSSKGDSTSSIVAQALIVSVVKNSLYVFAAWVILQWAF